MLKHDIADYIRYLETLDGLVYGDCNHQNNISDNPKYFEVHMVMYLKQTGFPCLVVHRTAFVFAK